LGRGLETGLQQFGRAALIVGTYALIKATAIPLLALSPLGLVGALAGNTLATVGGVILIVYFARGITEQAPIDYPSGQLKKNFLTAVPLSIVAFTSMILISLDLWVMKSLGTADKILGLYVVASMIPKVLLLLSAARVGMIISVIGRAKAARDYRATRLSFLKITTLFGAIIGLFTLCVFLFAEVLIRTIFSQSYIEAVPYLQRLIFSYAAFAFAETFSWTLVALGQAKKLALIWSGVSLIAFPTYIIIGRLWGPILMSGHIL
jgi:O-antigen/teichoic acid export membrane protein